MSSKISCHVFGPTINWILYTRENPNRPQFVRYIGLGCDLRLIQPVCVQIVCSTHQLYPHKFRNTHSKKQRASKKIFSSSPPHIKLFLPFVDYCQALEPAIINSLSPPMFFSLHNIIRYQFPSMSITSLPFSPPSLPFSINFFYCEKRTA